MKIPSQHFLLGNDSTQRGYTAILSQNVGHLASSSAEETAAPCLVLSLYAFTEAKLEESLSLFGFQLLLRAWILRASPTHSYLDAPERAKVLYHPRGNTRSQTASKQATYVAACC